MEDDRYWQEHTSLTKQTELFFMLKMIVKKLKEKKSKMKEECVMRK